MLRLLKLLILVFILMFTSGCSSDPTKLPKNTLPTFNKDLFMKDRYCSDFLKFSCLPESHQTDWQKETDPMDEIGSKEALHKEWDVKKKIFLELEAKNMAYKFSKEDMDVLERIEMKLMLHEMEVTMEKLYPGFWGDMNRTLRHRWMRLCIAKANKYGYGLDEILKKDLGSGASVIKKGTLLKANIRETLEFIQLCGRIGLYFDSDPKWDFITQFIKHPKSVERGHAAYAVEYIDFTVYNKDYSFAGHKISLWSLGYAFSFLPYPNRRVPSINDKDW